MKADVYQKKKKKKKKNTTTGLTVADRHITMGTLSV